MEKPVRSSFQYLSISYECALAIGNSLSLPEMLQEVIRTVVHKTNAHRGIIWVKKNGEQEFQPVANAGINTEDVLTQGKITDLLDVLNQIQKKQQFAIINKDDNDFLQYCPVLTGKEESVLVVPITNVAILYLVYASRDIADEPLANLLASLSKKLSVAIEACMTHENVIKEIQVREKAEKKLRKKTEQLTFSEKELQRLYGESEQARKSLLSILEDVAQKEEALKESESKLNSILSSINDIVFVFDQEGRFTFTQKPTSEQLYTTPDIFIGKKPAEVLPSHINKIFLDAFDKIKKGDVAEYDYWLNIDGKILWFSAKHSPRFIDGELVGSVSVVRDITTRKQAEERIEHLNSVLKAIGDVNQLIMTEKDREILLKKAGDALVEARGYEAAWLGYLSDGETFDTVLGSGFREDADRFCESVRGGDHIPCIEKTLAGKEMIVVMGKPGECRECRACIFKDLHASRETVFIRIEYAGALFGLLAISLAADVTLDDEEEGLLLEVAYNIALALHNMKTEEAHEKAVSALRESEEKYRSLFAAEPDAIFLIDAETMQHRDANDAALKLFGYDRDEFLTLHSTDISAEPEETVKKIYSGKIDNDLTVSLRYSRKKDGTIFPAEVSASFFELGGRKTVCAVIRDITERKKAEDLIKASLNEKEVLLREIHHRVKNNLQVVSSLLDMQARHARTADSIGVLNESKNRINAMALIHAQLYESRDLAEINMKGFVSKLLSQLLRSYQVQGTEITPVVSVADYPVPISMAVPVGLIVNELLSNTLKHAFVGRKEGTINVSLTASEEGRINLTVRDDGVGLPAGFDISKTGTLGLRLIKILTEDQLHGTLKVISKEGTTFDIKFDIDDSGFTRAT